MKILESILLAFSSIRQYKLRAVLTLLSIAIGVFAIMGSGTLTNSINNAVTVELANLGDLSYVVTKMPAIHTGEDWHKLMKRKPITYTQVKELKDQSQLPDLISAESTSNLHTVEAGNLSTDPDVNLVGTDENYFIMKNIGISFGRPIIQEDIVLNRNVAVIGNDIVVKIFPNTNPIGKKIRIKHQSFTVIGVLEQKGAILGQSQDNKVIIPISQFLKYYASWWEESLTVTIRAKSKEMLTPCIDETIGIMRTLRNVQPWQENSFEINTNESISQQFSIFTNFLSVFGSISGFIALIAAGVGIMNIMLVSVKERTREIGIRKAVGARRFWILIQFIIESITLCQVGGLIGIIIGFVSALYLGSLISINITFSLFWFIFSIIVCSVIGLIFGSYPAWKAARLDPIDALRYE